MFKFQTETFNWKPLAQVAQLKPSSLVNSVRRIEEFQEFVCSSLKKVSMKSSEVALKRLNSIEFKNENFQLTKKFKEATNFSYCADNSQCFVANL